MGLAVLRAVGVHDLLWAAATEIEYRGAIARGVHFDPEDDLVDAYGAICLAAGATERALLSHGDDVERVVPPAHQGRVLAAIEAVEGEVNADITTWSDGETPYGVSQTLRYVAERIAIATR